jgi:hypothetical protein
MGWLAWPVAAAAAWGSSDGVAGAFNGALLALSPSVSQIFLLLFFYSSGMGGEDEGFGQGFGFSLW